MFHNLTKEIFENIYNNYKLIRIYHYVYDFSGREYGSTPAANRELCQTPNRLCRTRYNTTAPMYGVSLTSGQPVTIVQKFPDLLQQVVYEVCE